MIISEIGIKNITVAKIDIKNFFELKYKYNPNPKEIIVVNIYIKNTYFFSFVLLFELFFVLIPNSNNNSFFPIVY